MYKILNVLPFAVFSAFCLSRLVNWFSAADPVSAIGAGMLCIVVTSSIALTVAR